jgi:hypothetical protein
MNRLRTVLLIIAGLLLIAPFVLPTILTYYRQSRSLHTIASRAYIADIRVSKNGIVRGADGLWTVEIVTPIEMFVGDTRRLIISDELLYLQDGNRKEILAASLPPSINAPDFDMEPDWDAAGNGREYAITAITQGRHVLTIELKINPKYQTGLRPLTAEVRINVTARPDVSLSAISTFIGIMTALSALLYKATASTRSEDTATDRLLKKIAKKRGR